MKIIDLRSDTVTMPSPAMRVAMSNAELGDDGWNEDPTVNRLQERAAELMGKEAALFVASGTMGNLVSLLAHCRKGEQVIAGSGCHIVNLEESGAATLGGIDICTIANQSDGTMKLHEIESAVNLHDGAKTKLICLENTWNGQPLSSEYMQEVRHIADRHGLRIHLDGARLFNAVVALQVSELELVRAADSVQFCLAKGLAAPAGSMICGDKTFIREAKRIRKMVGGGMRQIGMLAAAGLVALETMRERLQEDHATAKALALGLQSFGCFKVDANDTKTNMVFFDTAFDTVSRQDLTEMLKEEGILVAVDPGMGIRAVTHYGITESDIEEALERLKSIVDKMRKPSTTARC